MRPTGDAIRIETSSAASKIATNQVSRPPHLLDGEIRRLDQRSLRYRDRFAAGLSAAGESGGVLHPLRPGFDILPLVRRGLDLDLLLHLLSPSLPHLLHLPPNLLNLSAYTLYTIQYTVSGANFHELQNSTDNVLYLKEPDIQKL